MAVSRALAHERVQPAHLQARALSSARVIAEEWTPIAFRQTVRLLEGGRCYSSAACCRIRAWTTSSAPADGAVADHRRCRDPSASTRTTLAALAAQGKNVRVQGGPPRQPLVLEYRRALSWCCRAVYRTAGGTETPCPELLGQTLLEGMASGAATICTDVASMREIVGERRHGLRSSAKRSRCDRRPASDASRFARARACDGKGRAAPRPPTLHVGCRRNAMP